METKEIKTEQENIAALKRFEYLCDLEEEGKITPEEKKEADILEVLIDEYEEKHHAIK